MAKETAPNRRYTDELKLETSRLADSMGISQAAKRLGMPSSNLGNWPQLKREANSESSPERGRSRVPRQSSRVPRTAASPNFDNSTNAQSTT